MKTLLLSALALFAATHVQAETLLVCQPDAKSTNPTKITKVEVIRLQHNNSYTAVLNSTYLYPMSEESFNSGKFEIQQSKVFYGSTSTVITKKVDASGEEQWAMEIYFMCDNYKFEEKCFMTEPVLTLSVPLLCITNQ